MANHKHRWIEVKEQKDDYRVAIARGKNIRVFLRLPEKDYWAQKIRRDLKQARGKRQQYRDR